MKLNNKEAALVDKMIALWEADSLIENSKAKELKATYQTEESDVKTLTFYAFVAAVSCALLAFGALVLDEKWIEKMRTYFSFSEFTIALFFTFIVIVLIRYIRKRKLKYSTAVWANESLSILLGLSICVAITYYGKALSANNDAYYILILLAAISLGTAAVLVRSSLLWISMLAALVGWWASFTYSFGERYFLGMNMPLRLFVFSTLLLLIHLYISKKSWMKSFASINYYAVYILFLTTAWGISVFGNYSFDDWFKFRQSQVWLWALAYTLLLVGLLIFSIKTKSKNLRDLVLLFLLLNIYTRFFEYFWDVTNKGIFFAILALSFWFIGKQLESFRKKLDQPLKNERVNNP